MSHLVGLGFSYHNRSCYGFVKATVVRNTNAGNHFVEVYNGPLTHLHSGGRMSRTEQQNRSSFTIATNTFSNNDWHDSSFLAPQPCKISVFPVSPRYSVKKAFRPMGVYNRKALLAPYQYRMLATCPKGSADTMSGHNPAHPPAHAKCESGSIPLPNEAGSILSRVFSQIDKDISSMKTRLDELEDVQYVTNSDVHRLEVNINNALQALGNDIDTDIKTSRDIMAALENRLDAVEKKVEISSVQRGPCARQSMDDLAGGKNSTLVKIQRRLSELAKFHVDVFGPLFMATVLAFCIILF
ncbi:hypothetical protein HOY82DRAFT_534741 [Tuber indicum]|nr:hypothetical protein HOY82DRAFT_534741 [Tuber indicum]